MNDPILDQEDEGLEGLDKHLTRNIPSRALSYLGIMLLLGTLTYYFMYPKIGLDYNVLGAILFVVISMLISLVLESFRYLFRKRREKKSGLTEIRNPFWFEVVEGGFSIWLLIAGLLLLNLFAVN